ncbi:MAG: hypothetical protein AAF357_11955 [Verrucomicrobiota bacterium]
MTEADQPFADGRTPDLHPAQVAAYRAMSFADKLAAASRLKPEGSVSISLLFPVKAIMPSFTLFFRLQRTPDSAGAAPSGTATGRRPHSPANNKQAQATPTQTAE